MSLAILEATNLAHWRACVLLLGFLASAGLFICMAGSARAEFSSGQLSAITEHAYRGTTWVRTCGTTCEGLWTAEQEEEVKELTLELLRLRQEAKLLPTIDQPNREIVLTGSPQTLRWGVPGERPKIITIQLPARSGEAKLCGAKCVQAAFSRTKGTDPGPVGTPLPDNSFVWAWESIEARVVPKSKGCEGHPTVPSGFQILSGPSTFCELGTTQEEGYLPESGFVTPTSIRDETAELKASFKSFGPPADPGFEKAKSSITTLLSSGDYPYLVSWYRFQFGEGCDPSGKIKCEVPDCEALTVEACEELLDLAGFNLHETNLVSAGEANFYAPPDHVAGTSPAAGSTASATESISINENPGEDEWNTDLLSRFRPILVYPEEEVFHADSVELPFYWKNVELERQNGGNVSLPTLQLEYLGMEYPDENEATGSDALELLGQTPVEEEISGQPDESLASELSQLLLSEHPGLGDKVYGRVVTNSEESQTWLQYWFWYYYNPSPPYASGFGKHQGDWEMVQFAMTGLPSLGFGGEASVLGPGPEPTLAAAAEHAGGSLCKWSAVEKAGGIPEVYPAIDSHATYFGPYVGSFPEEDEVTGEGSPVRPTLVSLKESNRWIQWPGHWGTTLGEVPKLDDDSPGGPVTHQQWSEPSQWAQEQEEGGGC